MRVTVDNTGLRVCAVRFLCLESLDYDGRQGADLSRLCVSHHTFHHRHALLCSGLGSIVLYDAPR